MKVCRCLVTGATGFIGSALVRSLNLRVDTRVRIVTRNPARDVPAQTEVVPVSSIGPQTDWSKAVPEIDVVFHLAGRAHVLNDSAINPLAEFRRVNVEGTLNLAQQAAAAGVGRFIFVSSIGVNGNVTNSNPFSESDQPNPQEPYAVSKWEAEKGLLALAIETGMEVVIIRPPLVFGPNAPGNFGRLFRAVQRGIPLPLALANNQRSLIYLGNLISAITACISHPAATGKTYLLSDGEDISISQLIQQMAQALGKPSRLWPCPVGLLRLAGMMAGRSDEVARLLCPLCIDSSKIRRELGWVPPYTLAQGLAETAAWYCRHLR